MNIVSKEKTARIIEGILSIVLGVLLIVFPEIGESVFTVVVAVLFFLVGAFFIAAYFMTILVHDPLLLIRSVSCFLIGALILTFPDYFMMIAVILSSIYLIVEGIYHFSYSLDLESLGNKNWWVDLLYSIVIFLCGLSLIITEAVGASSSNTLMIIAGSFGILYGLWELIMIFIFHRTYKAIRNRLS